MRISEKLANLMNAQIGNEMGAALQYTQLAAYFEYRSLPKFAEFFFAQAAEEQEHAMKFLHYLLDIGAEVKIPAIGAPAYEVADTAAGFQMSLDWENEVTAQIHHMMGIAMDERDFAAQTFLQWFVTEQVEEVSTMETLLDVVKRVGEKNLFMIESYLERTEAPAP
ncbi:MAG: ferritin [Anaerolineae bacterium]|nr:ferritin [Anaerolineae bacterium]